MGNVIAFPILDAVRRFELETKARDVELISTFQAMLETVREGMAERTKQQAAPE